jgi:gas vesicle protein
MARNNGGSGSPTWFIVSVLVGVAAGMLLAPKPGRETREILGEQARNWGEQAGNWRDRANYQAGRLREGLTNKLGDSEKEALSKPRPFGRG